MSTSELTSAIEEFKRLHALTENKLVRVKLEDCIKQTETTLESNIKAADAAAPVSAIATVRYFVLL